MTRITVTVDGDRYTDDIEPRMLLVQYLRESLGKVGTVIGCDTSNCGACTVHLDGRPIRACVTEISSIKSSQKITTIEGLSPDGSHPVQKAWLEELVPQCGYCQSGQIMAAAALLERSPNPTDDQIEAAMTGHICRCGTYPRIKKAIHRAAEMGK